MKNKNQEKVNEKLVSIIMPAYNSEEFISESILSIAKQDYSTWELLIVDDCSSDNTVDIVKQHALLDSRIKLFKLKENSGAAVARNVAIKEAQGEYFAFLDSDDCWELGKLTRQIQFMEDNNYHFTCTSYGKVDENNRVMEGIKVPKPVNDYNDVLKNSPGTSTVIYNAAHLGKFYSPDIRRRNDFVMWLQVIKKAKKLYGIQEKYTSYRVRSDSLSGKKMKLVKYQWKVYRDYEKLPFFKSVVLLLRKTYDVIFDK